MKNTKKRGFTLIELIVVMAIIAILVLLASPRFLGYTKDAKVTAMQSDAKVLSNAALLYNIETEAFPVLETVPGTPDAVTLSVALEAHMEAINPAFDKAVDQVVLIDEDLMTPYVKSLNGEFGDYVLVTEGPLQGEVFHATGIANKAGVVQYGIKLN